MSHINCSTFYLPYMNFKTVIMTISLLAAGATASARRQAPVRLTWQNLGPTAEGTWRNCFTIKNISSKTLQADWCIYYNQLPRTASKIETNQIAITTINRNYFRMAPTPQFKPLKAGDELKVYYQTNRLVPNVSWTPEEPFFVSTHGGKRHKPVAVELTIMEPEGQLRQETVFADSTFKHNEEVGKAQGEAMHSLPTVKDMLMLVNILGADLSNGVSVNADKSLLSEAAMLKDNLSKLFGITVKKHAPASIFLRLNKLKGNLTPLQHAEQYTIEVRANSIVVTAETAHGVFNGTQTLLSLLKKDGGQKALEPMFITDYPDLKYRGLLLDIARNFIPVRDIRKLIDALSAYKINLLQLHFADDEGWRLQIPGLEELTEVGARRGYATDEQQCLYPAYGGGFDSKHRSVGTGFISRGEFISLLRYAAERHVTILPEIESPGHCRACLLSPS
ncbi:MAG: family 20 glycosylhydrolase [Prevotella sp.]